MCTYLGTYLVNDKGENLTSQGLQPVSWYSDLRFCLNPEGNMKSGRD